MYDKHEWRGVFLHGGKFTRVPMADIKEKCTLKNIYYPNLSDYILTVHITKTEHFKKVLSIKRSNWQIYV